MSAVGCVGSCCAGCLGSCACSAMTKGNTSDYRVSKAMAFVFQIVAVSLILIVQSTNMSSWGGWLEKIPVINSCGEDYACYARQIAYRIGFAGSCVFAFHLVLSFGRCCANKVLNSYWVFKFLFLVLGSAAFMFIPNAFFSVWGSIAEIALGWFLLVQMVWVLDFGYSWNDLWLTNARDDKLAGHSGKSWYIGILFFSLAFLAGAYIWFGMSLRSYAGENSNKMILWVNLAVSTVCGVFSLFAPRGGILPASLTILYIAWLSWSICWSGDSTMNTSDARLGTSMALAFVILLYSTIRNDLPQVTSNPETPAIAAAVPQPEPDAELATGAPGQASMEAGTGKKEKKEIKPEEGTWRAIVFLNLMHLSAVSYLMCLCLSWKNSPGGPENMIFYWVQAVAAWTMLVLYAWTLVAPYICTSRQF